MGIPIIGGAVNTALNIFKAGKAALAVVNNARSLFSDRNTSPASRPTPTQLAGGPRDKGLPEIADRADTVRDDELLGGPYVGRFRRQVVLWEIPQIDALISMYINPTRMEIQSQKQINEQRTKGGFIIQYWGEMLDTLSLSGTTGSGGVEGIQILRDIYRSEHQRIQNLKMDFGRLLSAELQRQYTADEVDELASIGLTRLPSTSSDSKIGRLTSSLGEQAASVVMHYQGASYRGYFTSMTITESAERIGLFDYAIQFKIVSTVGYRRNFLPWHRDPRYDVRMSPLSWKGMDELTDVLTKAGEVMRVPYSTPQADTSNKDRYMQLARDIYSKGLRGFGLYKFARNVYDTYAERGTLTATGQVLARTKYGSVASQIPQFGRLVRHIGSELR